MLDSPFIIFVISFAALWLSAQAGAYLHKQHDLEDDERYDLDLILTATLTLLSLIIGFSFSMALSRYDQRKNYEEAEANAIGTEYVRVTLLPKAAAAQERELLADYLNQRILFYVTRDDRRLREIDSSTARLQSDLWRAIETAAVAQPTQITALAVSGLNDVLNSQGYTQASWWNRIPIEAWTLMGAIAVCANLLFGYTSRRAGLGTKLFSILPLIVSISFFLIADLDSPRNGIIRVGAPNLVAVSHSIPTTSSAKSRSSSAVEASTAN